METIECDKIFLDTAPIIYFLQGNEIYFEKTKAILRYLRQQGTFFVSSDITVAEYLVMPYRENNFLLADALDRFIRLANIDIVSTDNNIAKCAARIRAKYKGFKAMDSFQIAAAIESGCDLFLTNDKQLRQFSDIRCLTIDDFPLS